jgi:serine/threonine protein kinase
MWSMLPTADQANCLMDDHEMSERRPDPLPVGSMIGQYRIVGVLGQGGASIVYEGADDLRGRVAIRELFPASLVGRHGSAVVVTNERDVGSFSKMLEQFERGAREQRDLDHPNLVRVRGYVSANNTGYLVMDYVDGEPMRSVLARQDGTSSERMFRNLFEPIADAIAYLHGRGLLHGGFSPNNVLIDRSGRPTLIDFGGRMQASAASPPVTAIAANNIFAAPEQGLITQEGAYTDVYGLAATMYYALAGEAPARAALSAGATYLPIRQTARIRCAPQIYDFIDRALHQSVSERPQSMAEAGPLFGAATARPRIVGDQAHQEPEITDPVEFGINHPAAVQLGETFRISAWIFRHQDRAAAVQRARTDSPQGYRLHTEGSAAVVRGAEVTVKLEIDPWIVEPEWQTVLWTGDPATVSFRVNPTVDLPGHKAVGACKIYANGLRIGHVFFDLPVGDAAASDHAVVTGGAYRSAFASYATKDRRRVLARVQGMEKGNLRVFVDVHDLRANDKYRIALFEKIESADVLYLFWSRYAARSEWVKQEWEYAMRRKGVDFIDPVPLVDPRRVPPPPELGDAKHFNDWTLAYLAYEKSLSGWDRVRAWLAGD